MTPDQISHMIFIFQRLTVPLVKHEIGVEVIRHCFDIFPAKQTQVFNTESHPSFTNLIISIIVIVFSQIIDVIADNLFEIATKESGSFLLRDVLRSKVFLLENRQRILSEIIANVHRLSLDPFG